MKSIIIDLEATYNTEAYDQWKETIEDTTNMFPPSWVWKILCMGYIKLDGLQVERLGVACLPETEAQDLNTFNESVKNEKLRVITWNGKSYDLPVISYRCLHHGIPMTWYHEERTDYKNRYKTTHHYDLKDYLADFGKSHPSLNLIAKLIGLPGKMETKGADVEQMYKDGKLEDIIAYCVTDVIQTYLIFLRIEYLRNFISKEQYIGFTQNFLDLIKNEGQLDLKNETHTVLGNNIKNPHTLAICKGCRLFTQHLDVDKLLNIL